MGYHDSHIHRLNKVLKERWQLMSQALTEHLPNSFHTPTWGSTSYWVKGDLGLDTALLAEQAQEHSLLLERGDVYFMEDNGPRNYFRLGYSSIKTERIVPGIAKLAELMQAQRDQRRSTRRTSKS